MVIREIKKEPDKELIEMAEELLKLVRKGEIRSLACAYIFTDASAHNCFVCKERPVTLVGELGIAQRDIMDLERLVRKSPDWDYCE